jgi:hypothetical protein
VYLNEAFFSFVINLAQDQSIISGATIVKGSILNNGTHSIAFCAEHILENLQLDDASVMHV